MQCINPKTKWMYVLNMAAVVRIGPAHVANADEPVVAELLPSTEVLCRADFPFLLNARGFIRAAVEVGVDRGTFAKEILTALEGPRAVLHRSLAAVSRHAVAA